MPKPVSLAHLAPAPPAPPGHLAVTSAPRRFHCTSRDPFGLGQITPQLGPGNGISRTEGELIRDRDASIRDFGMAINGPVFTVMGLALEATALPLGLDAALTVHELAQDGTDAVTTDRLLSAAIGFGVDAMVRRRLILRSEAPIIKATLKQAITEGGGRIREWHDRLDRDDGGWTREQDDIQSAVDRREHRDRVSPGTMPA